MIRNAVLVVILSLSLVSCQTARPDAAETKTFYGNDDRIEAYQAGSDPKMMARIRATAAVISDTDVVATSAGKFQLKSTPEENYLCLDERFRSQPVVPYCTAALVAPDLVVTAGHCVPSAACANIRIVFDFAYQSADADPLVGKEEDLYGCAEVVARYPNGHDVAIMRLDRKVSGREPMPLGESGDLAVGQKLTLLGHPVGWPLKVAPNGELRSFPGGSEIIASVDAYGGNSGSPILDAKSMQLVGILISGATDFGVDGDCLRSHVCSQIGCQGEVIVVNDAFRDLLQSTPHAESAAEVATKEVITTVVNIMMDQNTCASAIEADGAGYTLSVIGRGSIWIKDGMKSADIAGTIYAYGPFQSCLHN